MIIAKTLLLSFLTLICLIMGFYVVLAIRAFFIGLLLSLVYLLTIILLWRPELSDVIAAFFQIGRGLDLFLIISVFTLANVTFFVVRRLFEQNKRIIKIVRHLALVQAKMGSKSN